MRYSFIDHAWERHNFDVGERIDLSKCMFRDCDNNGKQYTFWLNDVGILHLFIWTNPVSKTGFLLYENNTPIIRDFTVDEVLYKFANISLSAYVFEDWPYYNEFKPNPVDNPEAKEYSTLLRCNLHFPDGFTFYSDGNTIGPAMEEGPEDRTINLTYERWNLNGDENLHLYLPANPEFYTLQPEFRRLEKPTFIKYSPKIAYD